MFRTLLFPVARWASFALLALTAQAVAAYECLPAPALAQPSGTVVEIASESELQTALNDLEPDTTLLLEPGNYYLSSTLYIRTDNITLRGQADDCDSVRLIGRGMDNADYGDVRHGIWTDAANLSIQNLSIESIYDHGVIINPGASAPSFYNLRLADTGQQFIKANPADFGDGVDDGRVEYSILEYTDGPPATDHGGGTGYTNGVDVHGGDGWVIANNLFANFHTPDGSDNLWNPAILMWNGASNTLAENNRFIDVDRAIAFGLANRANDHSGGMIRNNTAYYSSGLYSDARRYESDAAIIVWNSPGTQVYHNTVLTNGNLNKAIEFRFDTTGAEARNNLLDNSIGSRNGGDHLAADNAFDAEAALFVDPQRGDLHLAEGATSVMDAAPHLAEASEDIDGQPRASDAPVDLGADEYLPGSAPLPPGNFRIVD